MNNEVYIEVYNLRQLTKLALGICKPIKDFEEGFDLAGEREYYRYAADQGNANAQYNYTGILRRGQGGYRYLSGAREYFKRAADQGLSNL